MNKLSFLKGIVSDDLLNKFELFAEDELLIQKALEKSNNLSEFINSLISLVVCLVSRDKLLKEKYEQVLKKIETSQIKNSIGDSK